MSSWIKEVLKDLTQDASIKRDFQIRTCFIALIVACAVIIGLIATRPEIPPRPLAFHWGPTFGGYVAEFEDGDLRFDLKTDDGLYDNEFTFSIEVFSAKKYKDHASAQLAAEDLVLKLLRKTTEE